MQFKKNIFLLFLFTIICISNNYAQTKATTDPLLDILQSELQKNKAQLDQNQSGVYFLSYRVEDRTDHSISTSMGNLMQATTEQERILTVQVRVGDFNLDSYHELRDDYSDMFRYSTQVKLPLNDDSQAIAQTIWRETDKAYREAKQRYEKVKANIAVKAASEDHAPDFSYAPQEVYFEDYIIDTLYNENAWIPRIKQLSLVFAQNADALKGSAKFSYTLVRKYYVNSEKTSIVENNTYCHVYINTEGQAEDGMKLPLFKSFFAHNPQELPSQQDMYNEAQLLNKKISQLVKAPIVDSYSGPVILSNEAAGVFFHEIFGHRVEGQRMKGSEDSQTFKSKLGEQVLPSDLSVIFDPSITSYRGIPLNGSYKYDDEGFRGYSVFVVKRGILNAFLMSRTPIDHSPMSNGHARAAAGQQPVSRQSNLIVESVHPYSDKDLRAMLIGEAKAQGKEYAYLIASVEGGFTNTGRYSPNAFNVSPLEVYRIYVDGRPDELVRGADLVGTPLAMFSQIAAAGGTHGNFAGHCGAESGFVPVGCCSPALYVKNIELQKKNKSQERPPIIQKEYTTFGDTSDFKALCFEAMESEIGQEMVALNLPKLRSPYFISYLITDAHITSIESSLGGIVSTIQTPYRGSETTVLVGDDKCNNLHFKDMNDLIYSSRYQSSTLPLDNNYFGIRHGLWMNTDQRYKQAAEKYEAKQAAILQQNIPEEELTIGDRSTIVSHNNFVDETVENIDLDYWKSYLSELSLLFEKYPELTNSGVDFNVYQADAYYLDNEGLKYKQPFHIVDLYVYASTITSDGQVLNDHFDIYRKNISELPSAEEIKNEIHEFAQQLTQLSHAIRIKESYDGPVIFADQAAAVLTESCFLSTDGILAGTSTIFSDQNMSQSYGSYLDKRNPNASLMGRKIISQDLTVKTHNTWTSYKQAPLIGNFAFDADGYKSEDEQIIVENGILMQFLCNREPSISAPYSNGHNRLALNGYTLSNTLTAGVLELSSKNKSTYSKMKKKLVTLAAEGGYDYGYIVTKVDAYCQPIYCYKIDVKTGKEELVRMAKLEVPNIKSYKHIVGVSSEQQVYNTMHDGTNNNLGTSNLGFSGAPISLILPQAILFEEIEIQKDQSIILQKAPFIDNPLKK